MIHKMMLGFFESSKIERVEDLPVVGGPTSLTSGTDVCLLEIFY